VLGVRPEHYGPGQGVPLEGSVVMMETHGREDLFEVDLAGGGRVRAILPAGSGVGLGSRVDWGIALDRIFAFSPEGVGYDPLARSRPPLRHRPSRRVGLCAGNTLRAFELASDLGAEFWEVDIRTSADGVLVAHHDAETACGLAVSGHDRRHARRPLRGAASGLGDRAGPATGRGHLRRHQGRRPGRRGAGAADAGLEKAILGAFDPAAVGALKAAGVTYPNAALVPLGADPFEHAKGADIIHLCWERMERPQDKLTPEFLSRARANGQRVVLWHEEDPGRMADLRDLPILGICSDTPELVHPFRAPADWPVKTVAHRGANSVAPENTLPAASCAFAAGFDWVELDVRSSADGQLVVIHDADVARTTDGAGLVIDMPMAELRSLDAGGWFDPHFAGVRLPTLAEMLDCARNWGKGIYIEIKHADPMAVLREVQLAEMVERCFFWGWDYDGLRAIKAADPRARIMTRRMDFDRLEECFATLSFDIIEYDSTDDWSDMDAARAYGAELMICYMGRDASVFDKVIAARPDIVNIDDLFTFRRRVEAAGLDTHER
jgi:glycerophosphoryl diester phosphodiesterase